METRMSLPTYDDALQAARTGKPSASYLQRHLRIGYTLAATFLRQMELSGAVTAPDRHGKRHLITQTKEA
jgi:S-DNA-T family DNA segregation ATPase FtsK/SpoIIIE